MHHFSESPLSWDGHVGSAMLGGPRASSSPQELRVAIETGMWVHQTPLGALHRPQVFSPSAAWCSDDRQTVILKSRAGKASHLASFPKTSILSCFPWKGFSNLKLSAWVLNLCRSSPTGACFGWFCPERIPSTGLKMVPWILHTECGLGVIFLLIKSLQQFNSNHRGHPCHVPSSAGRASLASLNFFFNYPSR